MVTRYMGTMYLWYIMRWYVALSRLQRSHTFFSLITDNALIPGVEHKRRDGVFRLDGCEPVRRYSLLCMCFFSFGWDSETQRGGLCRGGVGVRCFVCSSFDPPAVAKQWV